MERLHTPQQAAHWLAARLAPRGGHLYADSRKVGAGDGFIAWPGAATDGRRHVPDALRRGALACLVEAEGLEQFDFDHAGARPEVEPVAAYAGLKAATGPIASSFYGEPSARLRVLAVTGTNGKTSTAWWLAQAVTRAGAAGQGCGLIGTLGVGRPPQVDYTGLTTPDPVLLQAQFRRFVDEGLAACAIEASSIGIAERRLDGTRIEVAVFTNFSQDHLDYHGTMDAYWAAKAELFDWPGLQAAVVNLDDPKGAGLAARLAERQLPVWTYSCVPDREARLQALDIRYSAEGLQFVVAEAGQRLPLTTRLIGQYNVANLLAVIGSLRAIGLTLEAAVAACAELSPVPGRMECITQPGQPWVAVDYAHTPDALAQALAALRPLAQQRGGRLWCVFGCGGDRDALKRPRMGEVASQSADQVLLTSDNPRSESPEAIVQQILQGVPGLAGGDLTKLGALAGGRVQVQVDRARAIEQALGSAAPNDVVLLAGKGHETEQEVAGQRYPFDDRAQARAALARRVAADRDRGQRA
jgi:UDP-N-acetylmuramyl-tripeptide synthetase